MLTTVLISSSRSHPQRLLDKVCAEGQHYGLELNWGKTYQVNVCSNDKSHGPDGKVLPIKREMIYLGGLVNMGLEKLCVE